MGTVLMLPFCVEFGSIRTVPVLSGEQVLRILQTVDTNLHSGERSLQPVDADLHSGERSYQTVDALLHSGDNN